jgi:hypothetical protein
MSSRERDDALRGERRLGVRGAALPPAPNADDEQRYVDLGSIDFARLRASASPFQRLLRRGPGTPRQARARRS